MRVLRFLQDVAIQKVVWIASTRKKHGFRNDKAENKALCGIEWVIKFQLTAQKVNHVNKILCASIPPCSSFC
jgi:hypothetical protein